MQHGSQQNTVPFSQYHESSLSLMDLHRDASPLLFCNAINLTSSPPLLHPPKCFPRDFWNCRSHIPPSLLWKFPTLYCSIWNLALACIHFFLLLSQIQTWIILCSLWSLHSRHWRSLLIVPSLSPPWFYIFQNCFFFWSTCQSAYHSHYTMICHLPKSQTLSHQWTLLLHSSVIVNSTSTDSHLTTWPLNAWTFQDLSSSLPQLSS